MRKGKKTISGGSSVANRAIFFDNKNATKLEKGPIFVIRAFFKKWPYVVKSPFRTFFSTKMEKNFVPRGWQPWSEDSSLVPGIVPRCFPPPPPPPPFKKKCRVFTFAAHFLSRKWGSGGRVPKNPAQKDPKNAISCRKHSRVQIQDDPLRRNAGGNEREE